MWSLSKTKPKKDKVQSQAQGLIDSGEIYFTSSPRREDWNWLNYDLNSHGIPRGCSGKNAVFATFDHIHVKFILVVVYRGA
jgi:hypothetical protein